MERVGGCQADMRELFSSGYIQGNITSRRVLMEEIMSLIKTSVSQPP
jgi:hypothetical protein